MKTLTMSAAALGVVLFAATTQASIDLDLANLPSTYIQFQKTAGVSTFNLTSAGGYQFQVTSAGAALGLSGSVAGGPWTLDPSSYASTTTTLHTGTPGNMITIQETTETVNVAPQAGTIFSINDGAGHSLTATLDWGGVLSSTSIINGHGTSSGIFNFSGNINLSNISYSGANSVLRELATDNKGTLTLSYNFSSSDTLAMLMANGGKAAYSVNVSAVPEPTTAISGIAALGFMFVFGWNIHRRKEDVVKVS